MRIITYGTFDMLHEGHVRLLERAKRMGDYLIVGVTSKVYDENRGKLNVRQDLITRIENLKKLNVADLIIVEEYEGQKVRDIIEHKVDKFVIGSDWIGKFDYLNEYCQVVYLERTRGISSTSLRTKDFKDAVLRVGLIGHGRIAERFVKESKYVSGINVEGVFGINQKQGDNFVLKNEIQFFTNKLEVLFEKVDCVYIATPHQFHYFYAKEAIRHGKHVMCEKPITLKFLEAKELFDLAEENKIVLMETIKTAYCPGYKLLKDITNSGFIGNVKSIDATFTKLASKDLREMSKDQYGGSIYELSSYPLFAIFDLLGLEYEDYKQIVSIDEGIDIYSKIHIKYSNKIATATVGLGVKSEGDMRISGTKGYIYVPAPWWKTEYFEIKYENLNDIRKYYSRFEGDGLRYEIAKFYDMVTTGNQINPNLSKEVSLEIVRMIEILHDNFTKKKETIWYI